MTKNTPIPAALAVLALALAGCSSSTADGAGDTAPGDLHIVASTSVYADIAQAVGGEGITVTGVVTSTAQDPHSYEVTAKDRVTIAKADLVVRNGGGYDSFMDALVPEGAPVVTAIDEAPDLPADASAGADEHEHEHEDHDHEHGEDGHDHAGHDHIEGFNEHVWYDPAIMAAVADDIAHDLGELDPAHAADYTERAAAFRAETDTLDERLATVAKEHAGAGVFVTEPVPLRLTDRADLKNLTPPALSEAVEEGQDVPPATLLEALDILRSGDVSVVILNTQTGGAESQQVEKAAKAENIPVIEFSEVLPEGEDYVSWMGANIDALIGALT